MQQQNIQPETPTINSEPSEMQPLVHNLHPSSYGSQTVTASTAIPHGITDEAVRQPHKPSQKPSQKQKGSFESEGVKINRLRYRCSGHNPTTYVSLAETGFYSVAGVGLGYVVFDLIYNALYYYTSVNGKPLPDITTSLLYSGPVLGLIALLGCCSLIALCCSCCFGNRLSTHGVNSFRAMPIATFIERMRLSRLNDDQLRLLEEGQGNYQQSQVNQVPNTGKLNRGSTDDNGDIDIDNHNIVDTRDPSRLETVDHEEINALESQFEMLEQSEPIHKNGQPRANRELPEVLRAIIGTNLPDPGAQAFESTISYLNGLSKELSLFLQEQQLGVLANKKNEIELPHSQRIDFLRKANQAFLEASDPQLEIRETSAIQQSFEVLKQAAQAAQHELSASQQIPLSSGQWGQRNRPAPTSFDPQQIEAVCYKIYDLAATFPEGDVSNLDKPEEALQIIIELSTGLEALNKVGLNLPEELMQTLGNIAVSSIESDDEVWEPGDRQTYLLQQGLQLVNQAKEYATSQSSEHAQNIFRGPASKLSFFSPPASSQAGVVGNTTTQNMGAALQQGKLVRVWDDAIKDISQKFPEQQDMFSIS